MKILDYPDVSEFLSCGAQIVENLFASDILSEAEQEKQKTPYDTQLPEIRPVRRKQSWTCINVKYGKHRMTALLDTGSNISHITVIGSVLAKKLNWKVFPLTFTMVKAANGDDMLLSGVAYVVLRVGAQDIDSEVLMSPDMTGLILGFDWMGRNECVSLL